MQLLVFSLLAAAALPVQAPRIGIINFYGVRKVPELRIRKALGFTEGQPLAGSKGDIEDRLNKIPGVIDSHLEATCCDQGKIVLYVGIQEKGAAHFDLRTPPETELTLPDEITTAYQQFLSKVDEAVHNGETAEDLTNGHSLMAYPEARAVQEQFVDLVKNDIKAVRNVLRNADDPEQRAIAAYVIGYAPKKADVVNDLQYALTDPDDTVRSNALRAMAALAVKAHLDPDAGYKIEPTWFIEMLNSLAWTDRNNASVALVTLTEDRDPAVLEELHQRALAALIEMARWKKLEHALPAYILLGRVLGIPEKQLQDTWSAGQRETVVARAQKLKH
ncbi:MAG: HEAT repeat domain-containing protein [Bryobacteraceae bacterium]